MLALILGLLLAGQAAANIIPEVRSAIAQNGLAAAGERLEEYRRHHGVTPEMLEAHSWLGRGALAAKKLDEAESYAAETKKMAVEELKKRPLDAEKHLPIALGAAIEVQAHVAAARGERDQAVQYLREELAKYRDTSIRTRIQKNINLLSLEGKQAPPIQTTEWLGPKPQSLSALKGKPILLFFWAHWCGDCKQQAPILANLQERYKSRGLVVIGPTQRYGYAERGREVPPEEELKYIDQVRRQHYAVLGDMPVPVSEESFKNWGSSTTPTLALIDRNGVVRMYNPGKMTEEALSREIESVL